MTLRVGVLPHADLPHILPCFRICRELLKLGHGVRILGSDSFGFRRLPSNVWIEQLVRFGLAGQEVIHRAHDAWFYDWFIRQIRELQLDVLILDAVWQGLAFGRDEFAGVKSVVVHHAGLPDFRSSDLSPWRFLHPNHPTERKADVRKLLEQNERSGRGLRRVFASAKSLTAAGRATADSYEFGCSELAGVPADRAMSLCPELEFPGERGRMEYFGSLLPTPGDVDWVTPPPEVADDPRPLIMCAFGTTGLQSLEAYQWLSSLAKSLATARRDCQVVVVIPDRGKLNNLAIDCPANLAVYQWVPLWEVLSTRLGSKVLVSSPGVGAFREAVASGSTVVAVPRLLDQFGAAARVEYFGLGTALAQDTLPRPEDVVLRVSQVLEDRDIQAHAQHFRELSRGFDATLPLKRFIAKCGDEHGGAP
jgi:UDP:flavonoid glycosyltransferase YjiC (YdhE family)